MKIVVSLDSFKGSLTSMQAAHAVEDGIRKGISAEIKAFPLSDGGEGFVESYLCHRAHETRKVRVKDAMLHETACTYAVTSDKTAIMEMASMCGITHIQKENKDILHASTRGLGEMITDALDQGCRHFIIGIGGSGTNDGGSGMLRALGYQLLDKQGREVAEGAYGLSQLSSIVCDKADWRLSQCSFEIACDVENPLLGMNGCSAVFGPQKGADEDMAREMDAWLARYATIVQAVCGRDDSTAKGSGAAGGLGYAFLSLLNAKLISGVDKILESGDIQAAIEECDVVVTGEGKLDAQTIMGKACIGIAKLAKRYGKPVVAFSGSIGKEAKLCNSYGIDAYFSIQKSPCTLETAMRIETAYENLSDCAQQVFRLWSCAKK